MGAPAVECAFRLPARYSSGMSVPVSAPSWSELSQQAKHERLLDAAGTIFARDGLQAPMPAVAAAAGAGVGSLYRQFPSKRELLAELVVRRLTLIARSAEEAAGSETDHWTALIDMLWNLVDEQSRDDLLGEALGTIGDHPAVVAATERATQALERLLAEARAEGRLRADATTLDLRLLFAATRAARHIEPTAWRRMLALLIDALAVGS